MDILAKVSTNKKVGIIGAGPAGLCAGLRSFQCGHDVTIFEQTLNIGGTWFFSPQTGVHTSMYEGLTTNIPKEMMQFDGFPFPDFDHSNTSFVPSKNVLKYLEIFSKPIKPYILFNHSVEKIDRHGNEWIVRVRKKDSNQNDKHLDFSFDVLFICNGHFSKPKLPNFYEKYQKDWIHSHDYRSAKNFAHQTVAIVGCSWSGMDITHQLKKIYLFHDNPGKFSFFLPSHVVEKSRPIDATPNSLILTDGSSVSDIDTIIYSTGYVYDFPFFNHQENPIVQVKCDGKMVSPLFEHVAHIDYLNSFFFIGLHITSIFTMCEHQVRFALALVAGHVSGFDENDVKNWEEKRLKELEGDGIPLKFFHAMGAKQFDYYRRLCFYIGCPNFTTLAFEKMASYILELVKAKDFDYVSYKNHKYQFTDTESFCIE